MFDWKELTLLLYIIARISGCILFNPILNRSNVPTLFRGGLILVLSIFVSRKICSTNCDSVFSLASLRSRCKIATNSLAFGICDSRSTS